MITNVVTISDVLVKVVLAPVHDILKVDLQVVIPVFAALLMP